MSRRGERVFLVELDPETGKASVVDGWLEGEPANGMQKVNVGWGCSVLRSVPVERIYRTRELAEARLREVQGS